VLVLVEPCQEVPPFDLDVFMTFTKNPVRQATPEVGLMTSHTDAATGRVTFKRKGGSTSGWR
jgi:hypothetical protein